MAIIIIMVVRLLRAVDSDLRRTQLSDIRDINDPLTHNDLGLFLWFPSTMAIKQLKVDLKS